jgi:hypothetical protein
MKAGRKSLIAVLCPLLVFGLFVAVQGCGGGGEQQTEVADVEEQAEDVKAQTDDVKEQAQTEVEETVAEAAKAVVHIEGYTCPMHPAASSLEPGNCGTCGMELEKAALHYTCSMCKGVHAHERGKCPKCGMDLVLRPVPDSPPSKPGH